ncbi:hypothetical protein COY26_05575 [Candidatus Woesearchaeota archaeon CG_4_10_14_0_2_um_filter_33_10]|nr:MAG: hypothetical protein AUJ83_04670 [Candidatus Woesearchaeota archaeon CG1_02_33_12]PIN79141.1 MAG: hypothetical protein COV14_00750 [Candidatus Woesearchaeota archaeon CG10_big_fil_rev_8_21_14_0_10_33_12]PIU72764.1 MAG: hypothetical protein COS79_01240 [Candidatus Woesearchaeota archaeon CG06_land_8_20_14_3_00_33_13]PIZ51807.1 MAG: hypothetical protein COY26_05575 [Candidatus Woesearchaeota archaeon CG_4_10_14_0_2_um_filter_33_10]
MNKNKEGSIPIEELVGSSIVVNGISIPVEELVGYYKVIKDFETDYMSYYTNTNPEKGTTVTAKRVINTLNSLLKHYIPKYREE